MLGKKIEEKSAVICIMGMGYVGLPLAVSFAKKGFSVVGFDVNEGRIRELSKGVSYVEDVPSDDLKPVVENGKFVATSDKSRISDADIIIICVPTPLRKTREPDLTYIISAVDMIRPYIKKDMMVVLESTTYPGTTEELIAPIAQEKGLNIGEEFFVAFSPERVDPANKRYKTEDIPKVVGGMTRACTDLACSLYSNIVPKVFPVSSARSAEMVKLLENTFRSINIALVNELAMMCNKMDIDIWEVIEAAKTKPFGFMAFYPGPGIGGHCIPCDPVYLSWRARLFDVETRMVELATEINNYMPHYAVDRIGDILNENGKAFSVSKILLLGVAYKADVSDVRESPAIEVIKLLQNKKAQVSYYDPFVESLNVEGEVLASEKQISAEKYDCIVITTAHSNVDYKKVAQSGIPVFDTRGVLNGLTNENVYLL